MAEAKLTVGNVEILVMHDAESALPLEMTFPNVSGEDWAPYKERYPEAFNGPDNLRAHFECYLVRSQGQIILVDTGIGTATTNPGTIEGLLGGSVEGSLVSELASAGVQPGDIDTVFMTHLHPDHVGWNLSGGESPSATFPNARYVAHQADWAAFSSPKDEEIFGFNFWESTVAPLERLGVLDLLEGEKSLNSEVTAIATPGHTPGSMSLSISSAGESALILGDVFHNPAQVTETDWAFSFDYDSDQAIQTRGRMVDQAEAGNIPIAICHTTGFGRVVRTGGRRYWQVL